MTALAQLMDRDDRPREDHFVHLHGVTWSDYQRLLRIRGDHSDLDQLASFLDRPTTSQAIRDYRAALERS
jgi:hypothetical protein